MKSNNIAPQYIKEAQRIHKQYQENVELLDKTLEKIASYKDTITGIYASLTAVEDGTDAEQATVMDDAVVKLQHAATQVESEQKQYEQSMKSLERDAQILYATLRERYSHMSDEQLRAAIIVGGADI